MIQTVNLDFTRNRVTRARELQISYAPDEPTTVFVVGPGGAAITSFVLTGRQASLLADALKNAAIRENENGDVRAAA